MADTRPDIILEAGVQTDLYAALNAQVGYPAVTVGTQLAMQNKSGSVVELTAKATAPTNSDGSLLVKPFEIATNDSGDAGAWAFSLNKAVINVRVA